MIRISYFWITECILKSTECADACLHSVKVSDGEEKPATYLTFRSLSTFFLKTGSRQKINAKPSILQKSRQSYALEAHQGMKSWQDLSLQKLYLSGTYTIPTRFHCLTAYLLLLL